MSHSVGEWLFIFSNPPTHMLIFRGLPCNWRVGASQPSHTTVMIILLLRECLTLLASRSDPTCRVVCV